MIKLSSETDAIKAVGEADFAGWVILKDEHHDYIVGTIGESVGALSLPYKKPLWWIKDKKGPLTAPIFVGENFLVVGFSDGELRKIDPKTGENLWKERVQLDAYLARKLTFTDGALLAVTAAQSLFKIDVQTGKVLWVYEGGYPTKVAIRNLSAPTYYQGVVYYGLSSGQVAAVHFANGKEVWRKDPHPVTSRFNDVIGEMVVVEDALLFSRVDGVVHALSVANPAQGPEPKWPNPLRFASVTSAFLHQGVYHVGTANGMVHALDASTGKTLWVQNCRRAPTYIFGGDAHLFVTTGDGLVFALSASNGNVEWEDDLRGNLYAPPIFVGGNSFYVATGLQVLYGYR